MSSSWADSFPDSSEASDSRVVLTDRELDLVPLSLLLKAFFFVLFLSEEREALGEAVRLTLLPDFESF